MTFPEGILSLSNNYSIWQTLLAVNTHTDDRVNYARRLGLSVLLRDTSTLS